MRLGPPLRVACMAIALAPAPVAQSDARPDTGMDAGKERPPAGRMDAAWFGTWHLNLTGSVYDPGPPPYARASYTIRPWEDGVLVVYDQVRPRGGVTHLEWIGRMDGKDYLVQGVEELVTYAYRQLAARTYEIVTKLDGRVAATSRAVLSADSGTITTTTKGRDARGLDVTTITVYEKRAAP
jgi:hypothetical protein